MILYYSGCGNSRYVAERLADSLQEPLHFIPETGPALALGEGEALGFVFPVYAWAPPHLVLDFIRRMQLDRRPSYLWFACTCGDEGDYTRQVFSRALRKAGLSLDACFCLKMPETYLGLPGFALDTAENERQKLEVVRAELPRISELIAKRTRHHFEMLRGSFPLTKTYLLQPLFYRFVISDRKFHVTEACIGCGRCEKGCPVHNIQLSDGKPVWQGQCIHCMACYHHCPTNAVQYGKITQGKGQYRGPEGSALRPQ